MIAAELVLGAIVVLVLLGTIREQRSSTTSAAFVGGAVTLAAMLLQPISGVGINPARSLATAIFADTDPNALGQVWVFILVPIVAAFVGLVAYLSIDDSTIDSTIFDDTVVEDLSDAVTRDSTMAIPRRVAFIRAIMIGREGLHREVVLDLFREAGAIQPRNHLATGNVSFTALAADAYPHPRARRGRHRCDRRATEARLRPRARPPAAPRRVRPVRRSRRRRGGVPAARGATIDLPLISRTGRTSVFASNGTELFAISEPSEAPGAG